MSRTLVSYAGRTGGTEGIARAVADQLRRAGIEVDLHPAQDVADLSIYDSVVLGSAVYAGRWQKAALKLLHRLARRPLPANPVRVWLFHSGPTGPNSAGQVVPPPRKVAGWAADLGAAPPITFGGRIEPATAKGFLASRMATTEMGGDYRDFDEINSWARGIAGALTVDSR